MGNSSDTPLQKLEAIISSGPNNKSRRELVRRQLAKTDIYALGRGEGEDTDVLHISLERDGQDREAMPVFTRPDFVIHAQASNSAWDSLQVILLSGRDLIKLEDPSVTILINPSTELEFELPLS
jgi:hypothetical protein